MRLHFSSFCLLMLMLFVFPSLQTTTYYVCPLDYFFDVQHCQTCQPHCTCTVQNTCNSCIAGYTLYNNACIQCPQSSGIYGTCTGCCSRTTGTILSCTDCSNVANQYAFLYSGRCIVSPGCFEIDKNGFCVECLDGFYETNNLCYSCHLSCATCSDFINCITCAPGYYWSYSNQGICSACPGGCSQCDSSGSCRSCLSGYYFYTNHCLNCPAYCNICSDGSTCLDCQSGILVSNLCILCTDSTYGGSIGCSTCQASNNFVVCTQCSDTYFLDSNGICRSCASYIAGAVRCRDQNTPTQCQNDYSLTLANRYYLVGITCIQNTKNCKKIADIYANCSNCYTNYILSGGSCVVCPFTGCVASNSTVVNNVCKCSVCSTGYYLANGAVVCSPCTTVNCAICLNNVCTQCKPNFYKSGASCLALTPTNCLVGNTVSTCTTCQNGFYRGTDAQCYSCQPNCLICSSRFACTSCAAAFFLQNQVCVQMPSNCLSLASNNTCNLCSYGYYNTQGVCLACSIELGTLNNCVGLCPVDYYIQNLVFLTNFSPLSQISAALLLIIYSLTM